MYQNLGGIMLWSIDMDDYLGDHCDQGTFPLTSIVMDTLKGKTLREFDFSRPKNSRGGGANNSGSALVFVIFVVLRYIIAQ